MKTARKKQFDGKTEGEYRSQTGKLEVAFVLISCTVR